MVLVSSNLDFISLNPSIHHSTAAFVLVALVLEQDHYIAGKNKIKLIMLLLIPEDVHKVNEEQNLKSSLDGMSLCLL